jgi:hypothetical protein
MLLALLIVACIAAVLAWVFLTTPPRSWHQQLGRDPRRRR